MDILRKKDIETIMLAHANKTQKLKRTLGTFQLTTLGVGAIIGTGIFVLTGIAAANFAGPSLVLSFLISGLASALAALLYAELAAAIPVSGSAYTFAYVSLGELAAWLIGWNIVLEYAVAAGAVAIGWSAYMANIFKAVGIVLPNWLLASPFEGGLLNVPAVLITLTITVLLGFVTKESVSFNSIIVVIKVAVILLFITVGIFYIKPVNYVPFVPFGFGGIIRGAAIIFFAYIGFDAVATAAEEVKEPQRNLPRGIVYSLLISTVLYVAVAAVITGMVKYSSLNTASPVATAFLLIGMPWISGIISVGAVAGLTSVLLVTIYAQSRIFFAMARDGLLPNKFANVHPRYGTPMVITTLTGLAVALIAGLVPVQIVAEMANIGTLSAFVIVAISMLVLRKTKPNLHRPFKVGFVPYLPVISILISVFLMLNLPRLTWIRFAFWLLIGLVIYFAYGYQHSDLARPERNRLMGQFAPASLKKKLFFKKREAQQTTKNKK